jgi:hypothetical protein
MSLPKTMSLEELRRRNEQSQQAAAKKPAAPKPK